MIARRAASNEDCRLLSYISGRVVSHGKQMHCLGRAAYDLDRPPCILFSGHLYRSSKVLRIALASSIVGESAGPFLAGPGVVVDYASMVAGDA